MSLYGEVTCTVLDNGDLEITADAEARSDMHSHGIAVLDDMGILREALEPYWTNGQYEPFDASDGNPFVGLTSAPCIAESLDTDDMGDRSIDGRLWWFPNYMIESPVETLRDTGRVVFTLAGEAESKC